MMSKHHDVALTIIAVSATIVVLTTIVALPSIFIFATNVCVIIMKIYSILNLRAKINPEVLKKVFDHVLNPVFEQGFFA